MSSFSDWRPRRRSMMKTTGSDRPLFDTPELLGLTGLTRWQLQALEKARVVTPACKGSRGRGHSCLWTPRQVFALSAAKVILDAGLSQANACRAARWVMSKTVG